MSNVSLRPGTTVAQAARRGEQAFAWHDKEGDRLRAIVLILPANARLTAYVVMVKIGDNYYTMPMNHDEPVYCVSESEWNRLAGFA